MTIEFQLLDGSKHLIPIQFTEDFTFHFDNHGLLKADGTRGKYYVVVHLQ